MRLPFSYTDVAFHAQQYADGNLSKVILNQVDHYNKTTEKFVCPVKGLYIFSLARINAPGFNKKFLNILIYTSTTQLKIIVRGGGRNGHGTIVAVCSPGESVYMSDTNAYSVTIFSGALLSQMSAHSTTVSLLH